MLMLPNGRMEIMTMSDNPIRADARHARRQRTLGTDAVCPCGETDPRCLITTPTIQCYACAARDAGQGVTEAHHLAGQHNRPETVPIPNNEHRILSDMQQDWPTATLRNPHGSPLLQAAAAIRGWLDVLVLILERTVGWVPALLEALDAWLCARLGTAWPADFRASTPGLVPPCGGGGR
jgi:hypothetical protein